MALTPQSIPAMYGGVSQQAAVSRNPSQCEEAINCDFSVARGVSKRPPLEVISQLTNTDLATAFLHFTRISNGRWFVLVVPGDGTYSIYDADTGAKITTTNDSSQAYLTTTGAANLNFFAVDLDGKTHIANREIQVTLASGLTAGSLSGTAQTLQDDVLTGAASGAIYEIIGDADNDFDSYYAKKSSSKWFEWVKPGIEYQITATTMPHAVDIVIDLVDPLGVNGDFSVQTWADRQVGDAETNKAPSFVGRTIDSMFFKSDRLGLISGQSFTCTQVGEYDDFWRKSVTDVVDDDRIDETVNAFEVSDLYFAEAVSKSLVLFANERQFSVDGQLFSPKELSINPITSFPTSEYVRPVTSGSTVYFNADAGQFSQLREMFVQADTVTMDATDVSSHVARYLPSNLQTMEAHTTAEQLLMASPDAPNNLYSYQYHWQGDQKAMSAWGTWSLGGGVQVLQLRAIGAYMYVVYKYHSEAFGDATYLGKINLKSGDVHDGFTHKIHLDQLQKITATYNGGEDRTYFSSIFPIMDTGFDPHLVRGEGWSGKGTFERPSSGVTTFTKVDDKQFYLTGDWTGVGTEEWWVGLPYEMRYRFSEQYPYRDQRPMLHARLQIRSMTVAFMDTGFFRTDVKVRGHDIVQSEVVPDLTTEYTARTVGDEYFRLNAPQLATGTFQFPVLSRASDAIVDLVNDSPLPCSFQSAEWKGLISTRTQR